MMSLNIQKNDKHKRMCAFAALLLCASLASARIPGFYFADLIFNFGGDDSALVNSLDYFGRDDGNQSEPHAAVIDPEGKYWIGFAEGYSNEIVKAPGDTIKLTGIRCFLPDGSEASFSPLELIEFPGGDNDTLYERNPYNGNCSGMSLAEDGNILYTAGPTLYKLDHTDGAGIAKWDPTMIGKPRRTYLTAVQDCSYIYFSPYPQFEQLNVLDKDLNFVAAGMSLTQTLQNAIEVRTTPDSITRLYSGTHSDGQGIFVYESTDPSSIPFTIADTIGIYSEETDTNVITYIPWATSMNWINKEEGWLLYGNEYRAKTTVNTGTPPESPHASRWVAIDVDTDEMLYMFGAPWYDVVGGLPRPREVAFNVPETYLENNVMTLRPSGAHVHRSGDNYGFTLTDMGLNCVQTASFGTAIDDNEPPVPYGLILEQNYPNPFNPFSTVRFELVKSGRATLNIYDLAGKKIKEIFSGYLESGMHNMLINASELASGTYIYTLHTNDLSVSRKMTIVK